MRIGFIGLGTMGNHMAMNVRKAGYELTVHDIRREAAGPHLAAGARWADSPRAVAQASDVVLTSLPGPKEVTAVVSGPDGIAEGLARGGAYVDLSTSSPSLIRRIAADLKPRGIDVLDAPVSGGPQGAESRNLAVMVGGDEAAFQRVRPVLDAIGTKVFYTGAVGCGSVCKLMHNCISFALQTAVAECLTVGVKAGVEPRALWETVRRGNVGTANLFHVGIPATLLRGQFDKAFFALKLAAKDVDLATALGREYGVPMRVSDLAFQELLEAMARGWGDKDWRAAMVLQEERAGVQVRATDLDTNPPQKVI